MAVVSSAAPSWDGRCKCKHKGSDYRGLVWSCNLFCETDERLLAAAAGSLYTARMSNHLEHLACAVPEQVHPVCERSLEGFAAGESSVHSPAYTCNMVDSSLIPLVECLLDVYADGILLITPIGL